MAARPAPSTQLDTAVGGGYAVNTGAISSSTQVHAFGYPAAGKYKGKDLTYCAGPTFQDGNNANATWGIACNMTGGSSGGPWFKDFAGNGSSGSVTSLNSYGYQGLANMYGPKFNSDTAAVLSGAGSHPTSNYKSYRDNPMGVVGRRKGSTLPHWNGRPAPSGALDLEGGSLRMSIEGIIVGLLAILIGAAWATYGLKAFTILLPIWAFFIGLLAGANWGFEFLGEGFLGTVTSWIIGLVLGVVLAALSYFFYYAAIALLGGTVGYTLTAGLLAAIGLDGFLSVVLGLIVGVLFAVAVIITAAPILLVIVLTAFSGAAAVVNGALILLGTDPARLHRQRVDGRADAAMAPCRSSPGSCWRRRASSTSSGTSVGTWPT